MPFLTPDLEYQPRRWSTVGTSATVLSGRLPVGKGAIAEIKPHNPNGDSAGLKQLHRHRFGAKGVPPLFPDSPQWLVTYLPVDKRGGYQRTGSAAAVRVFARSVAWPDGKLGKPRLGHLHDLGKFTPPKLIPFPRVDLPGFFGAAVEEDVRKYLYSKTHGHGLDKVGGATPGPDARWQEIASLYSELSRLTGDPHFAEIAAELQAA